MRKLAICIILFLIFTLACSITVAGKPGEKGVSQPIPPALTPTTPVWPPVTGPAPSARVAAFYYPWYFNLEADGRWDHWGEHQFNPPLDIASDYFPVLGAYSESEPAVLARHFAWLREAGVGVIISSWWGRYDHTDRALPLMLDIADHYGIKIAFHIEPYSGRTTATLARDLHYIMDTYGDHPAFFWTTRTSLFSPGGQKKGLFFIWASATPDSDSPVVSPDYWRETLDALHGGDPGAIVLTDQNDPVWITESHFDGSYNYGVLESDEVGYSWALDLPADVWFVPGINPGFSAKRIGYDSWTDTPRRNGETYIDRWERMFAVGIEPELVVVTTFNEWHEGTQIEPAQSGVTTPAGYVYLDYEGLPPDGYLKLTREYAQRFLAYQWQVSSPLRVRVQTSSDWTDLFLLEGAAWSEPRIMSTSSAEVSTNMVDGRLSVNQPIKRAEGGVLAETVFTLRVTPIKGEDSVVFGVERGDIGSTTVVLFCQSDGQWVEAVTFTWDGITGDGRNAARFDFTKEYIFCRPD